MWARHPEHHKIGRDTMKKSKELLKIIPKAPERTKGQNGRKHFLEWLDLIINCKLAMNAGPANLQVVSIQHT
jgi:hypothetical protein